MKLTKFLILVCATALSSCNEETELITPEHECETHYASMEITETFPPTVEVIGWEETDTLCICDELVLTFDTNLIGYYLNHGWVQNFQTTLYADTFVVADSSNTQFSFFFNEASDSTYVQLIRDVHFQPCD